jgi:hypothetical protein
VAKLGAYCLVIALLTACTRPMGSTKDDWARWFDATTVRLPRWDAPAATGTADTVARTRDGLAVRLGSDFHKRNDFCWDRGRAHFPAREWIDICIVPLQPELELEPGFFLTPRRPDPRMSDQYQSEEWQAGNATIGGRRAIVERARVTGGMELVRRERRIRVLLEVGKRRWVCIDGSTGEDAGYSEILNIAGTVEVP